MLDSFLLLFFAPPDPGKAIGPYRGAIIQLQAQQSRQIASGSLQVRVKFKKKGQSVVQRSRLALARIVGFFRNYHSFEYGWLRKHNDLSVDFPLIKLRVFTTKLTTRGYEVIDLLVLIKPVTDDVVNVSIVADGSYVVVGSYPYRTGMPVDDIFTSRIREEALALYLQQVLIPDLRRYLERHAI